jgi:single-strand DNA-binding protein
MLNKVLLIGNLGADPEMRYTPDGRALTTFRMAVHTRLGYDQDGQAREEVEWFTVVVFGRQAESCAAYLQKGARIFVEGRLRSRSFMGSDGLPRFQIQVIARRVIFLSAPRRGSAAPSQALSEEEDLLPEEDMAP